jgi:hypothetical protein
MRPDDASFIHATPAQIMQFFTEGRQNSAPRNNDVSRAYISISASPRLGGITTAAKANIRGPQSQLQGFRLATTFFAQNLEFVIEIDTCTARVTDNSDRQHSL